MREDLLPVHFEGKVSKVLEECGEVIHCIGKYQRHGAIATDPKTKIEYNNLTDMSMELNDLKVSIGRLLEEPLFRYVTSSQEQSRTPSRQAEERIH